VLLEVEGIPCLYWHLRYERNSVPFLLERGGKGQIYFVRTERDKPSFRVGKEGEPNIIFST